MKCGKYLAVDPICAAFKGKVVHAVQVNGNLLYGQLDANAPRWVVDAFVRGKSGGVGLVLLEQGHGIRSKLKIYRDSNLMSVALGDWLVYCDGDIAKAYPDTFLETYTPVAKVAKEIK